jgi:hypothetical protein
LQPTAIDPRRDGGGRLSRASKPMIAKMDG